jgi:hypothetical protein
MPRGRISIGVDDATGQPANAPRGPYITDEDDGSLPRPKRGARRHAVGGTKGAGPGAKDTSRSGKDLAPRRKGRAQP